jgi:NADPH:quinone reductase-like Zn-dependent oxidoreductase
MITRLVEDMRRSSVDCVETDWVSRQGHLYVNRITENTANDKMVADTTSARQSKECHLAGGPCLQLHIGSPGHLDSLQWRESESDPEEDESLADDQVLIQLHAIGLSRHDSLVAKGQLDDARTGLGTECAGIVLAAGANSGFSSGDRVLTITSTACQTRMHFNSDALVRVPSEMSLNEAASLPSALWLAYHGLVSVARLAARETVLIHDAASSEGQLAVQLARSLGAKVLLLACSSQPATRCYRTSSARIQVTY